MNLHLKKKKIQIKRSGYPSLKIKLNKQLNKKLIATKKHLYNIYTSEKSQSHPYHYIKSSVTIPQTAKDWKQVNILQKHFLY